MFHIELRQFPHSAWRFNLSESELWTVVMPWVREQVVELGERKWSPLQATLTILEGPELEIQELSMGRGWRTALRRSQDITERVLAVAQEAEQKRAEADETARIEQAARAQIATREGSAPPAPPAPVADPLALGVQLAGLLGSDPARLLAAWQRSASQSPELSPSQTLALAENALSQGDVNSG